MRINHTQTHLMIEMKDKIENKNLWLFFLMTFAWSWLLWLPEILWSLRLYLAPFSPTIAAFILTYMNEGLDGTKSCLGGVRISGFGKVWLIPIFLLMSCYRRLFAPSSRSQRRTGAFNAGFVPAMGYHPGLFLYSFPWRASG